MSNDVITTVSLSVAASQWDVSVGQLKSALKSGVEGARKLGDGDWEIPTAWLDSTYDRHSVIDLRDVGSELSVVLDHLLTTRERLGEAEVRAVKAETETKFLLRDVDRLENEIKRAEADAEHWLTQHDEREQDLVAEQIKTAQATALGEELRGQLADTEVRLDGTYKDLIEVQTELERNRKQSVFSLLRRSSKSN